MTWAPLAATLPCYLLFNAAMFSCIRVQAGLGAPRRGSAAAVFAVNFSLFTVFSMFQFNLVANWLAICVLFLFEIKWAFRCSWRTALFCALLASLVGLGANVLTRSLCAIVLDVPQSAFSNDTQAAGNVKWVPVALGFLLGALLMQLVCRRFCHGEAVVVGGNGRSWRFVLAIAALGYLYLCSILLLYYVDSNGLVVKAWALKAVVSVFASVSLAFYYAYRTASVIRRSEQRRALEREVAEREHEGDELQDIARRDELTGCCTRRYAEARIRGLLAQGRELSLAFVDVNDLKAANDAGGHEYGDAYIASVAAALDNVLLTGDDVLGRFESTYARNFYNYSNPTYDQLINDSVTELDEQTRIDSYKRCQEILTEDAVGVFICDPNLVVASRKDLKGYTFYPVTFHDMTKLYYEG